MLQDMVRTSLYQFAMLENHAAVPTIWMLVQPELECSRSCRPFANEALEVQRRLLAVPIVGRVTNDCADKIELLSRTERRQVIWDPKHYLSNP